MYEAELRERRVELQKAKALRSIFLKLDDMDGTWVAFVDAMFPENVTDRQAFVDRNVDIMTRATEAGPIPVAPVVRKRLLRDAMPFVYQKDKHKKEDR